MCSVPGHELQVWVDARGGATERPQRDEDQRHLQQCDALATPSHFDQRLAASVRPEEGGAASTEGATRRQLRRAHSR